MNYAKVDCHEIRTLKIAGVLIEEWEIDGRCSVFLDRKETTLTWDEAVSLIKQCVDEQRERK